MYYAIIAIFAALTIFVPTFIGMRDRTNSSWRKTKSNWSNPNWSHTNANWSKR